MALVEQGHYFTINRPRQYGKTTILDRITDDLKDSTQYLPLLMSLQGIDEKWYQSDAAFAIMFMDLFLLVS